jgi:hypothetical protein
MPQFRPPDNPSAPSVVLETVGGVCVCARAARYFVDARVPVVGDGRSTLDRSA